ncbi:hypothetical protein H696_01256 [Fonticula alba]|uniref:EamA domain-containing protein n=1 Tax=Fonticula alba TaxID=691883 RepID=A0A058ZD29_FONAL|nr:hypothetical protein, variant [Fonticula alba]XP_009493417.1 hypothetical protein H696_01256 [Fonticula alba]KCV71838.1 hypothetical protein H696_01256 [Fonticula alba]KCV71839.1 hypothetical protein, variant [Fonticula alba]|eukprot:XP_009493416.1 hypothetical protein, variant [Fonticula alba]
MSSHASASPTTSYGAVGGSPLSAEADSLISSYLADHRAHRTGSETSLVTESSHSDGRDDGSFFSYDASGPGSSGYYPEDDNDHKALLGNDGGTKPSASGEGGSPSDQLGGQSSSTEAPPKTGTDSRRFRLAMALVCMFGLAISWVAQGWLGQSLQDSGYENPYIMSYFGHSMFALGILIVLPFYKTFDINPRRYLMPTFVLACISFLMLYLWYLSLNHTMLSLNTAIYQCVCVVVYFLSMILLKERADWRKFLAVAVCITGVFLTAFAPTEDDSSTDGTALGYMLLIGSTILYGLYEVLFAWYRLVPPDAPALEGLLASIYTLGLTGVWTFLIFWIGMPILQATGFENIALPPTPELRMDLLILWFVVVIYHALLLICLFMAGSPLLVSVGTILAVPTAILVEFVAAQIGGGPAPSIHAMAWAGMCLIVLGSCC